MHEKPPTILEHFSALTDPRVQLKTSHKIIDIVVITICGTICGANNWTEVVRYGRMKQQWLKKFLELPNGIPSHDTFGRVFSLLSPKKFQRCFLDWIQAVFTITGDKLLLLMEKCSGTHTTGLITNRLFIWSMPGLLRMDLPWVK